MKTALAIALTASLLSGDDDKAELGKTCPDLTVKDLSGKEIKLSGFRKTDKEEGKVVLVHFWSYKCPSGAAILNDVRTLSEKCEKEGIAFVGICAYGETEDQLKKFADREQIKYTLCYDAEKKGAKLFSAPVVTFSCVLDKEGKLCYRGAWEKAFDAALCVRDGKEVKEKDTRAKG